MNSITLELVQTLQLLFPTAAVFEVDAQRRITEWSPGAEALLGYPRSAVMGQSCLVGNRCDQCMSGCGLTEQRNIQGYKLRLYHQAGHLVEVRKYAYAYEDREGNFQGGLELLLPEQATVLNSTLDQSGQHPVFHGIHTHNPQMQAMFNIIRNVSQTDVTVLIRGESGSGKELVARAIHLESSRKDKPFVAVNCAALSDNLLESELFGHKKGAFTGAIKDHQGLIQQAQGGTLFLDEIAELPLPIQGKLLRVLQERVFVPLGGEREQQADIRIVSATHQSLRALVKKGQFREDLMYRLRVVPIFLPPLRERQSDITLLTEHFLKEFANRHQREVREFAPEAIRLMLNYDWPGNIRELRNVIEYANAVSTGTLITVNDLPREIIEHDHNTQKESIDTQEFEKQKLKKVLLECEGDLDSAARQLGISRTTLWRKRKKYRL